MNRQQVKENKKVVISANVIMSLDLKSDSDLISDRCGGTRSWMVLKLIRNLTGSQ